MKNLKRVLSLALTGVMLVGMMAIGASAANKDFTDADEIQHTEAVDVMSTLGVLKGKDTGAFDPSATVTRAEMAKIICVMLNGGNDPTLGSGNNAMFSDIANHWAKNYIEYCASMKIIAGQGDGTFAPDAPVTGAAAAKMLLVAMGYDSEIFNFTGMDWEINVNRQANEAKLYEEIKNIDTSVGLSRDNTAQMAYNALEAKVMKTGYDKVVSTGEISYNYGLSEETFLNKYFQANTFVGTFENNDKTGTGLNKGFIEVIGKLDTADEEKDGNKTAKFPYDFDIANLGEEVKVIFKDGKSGTKGQPDKNDTIFGVFNTGATETVVATLNDIAADKDAHKDPDKVEIDDIVYTVEDVPATGTAVAVVKDFGAQTAVSVSKDGTTYKQAIEGVAAGTGDTIKLLLKDGKVYRAYVTTYTLAKVTSASSTKITLSGVGAIELKDNDVYEDAKKDDIVVYTKFYDADKDKAYFTVTKAETVEGKITGYDGLKKVSIDGTSYNVPNESLKNTLTDDSMSGFSGEIGTEVKAYLVGGMVGAVDKIDDTVSNYALVVGATTSSTSDKTLSDGRIRLMTTDGTKTTYNVDEKSTYQPASTTVEDDKTVAAGTLVKFSVTSSGTVKISSIYLTKKNTTDAWNADTKVVATEAVAESGAVLYYTNPDGDYKVSAIRDLKTIDNKVFKAAKDVFFIKNDAGKIVAAFVDAKQTLPGATSSRLYGMVIGTHGTVKVDDDECTQYTVWTGTDEVKVNLINSDDQVTLKKGQFVTFEESVDATYGDNAVVLVSEYDTDNVEIIDAAVKEYSNADKIVSYYTELVTKKDGSATLYVPKQVNGKDVAPETLALDKDAVIVYVDAKDNKAGADGGVGSYDNLKGFANVKMLKKDGVVVVLFVETSGERNINGTEATLVAGKVDEHTHNYTKTEAKAATCTENGNKEYYSCQVAGCDDTKKYSDAAHTQELADWEIKALGHTLTTATKDADSDPATHTGTCDTCSKSATLACDTKGAGGVCSICGE